MAEVLLPKLISFTHNPGRLLILEVLYCMSPIPNIGGRGSSLCVTGNLRLRLFLSAYLPICLCVSLWIGMTVADLQYLFVNRHRASLSFNQFIAHRPSLIFSSMLYRGSDGISRPDLVSVSLRRLSPQRDTVHRAACDLTR